MEKISILFLVIFFAAATNSYAVKLEPIQKSYDGIRLSLMASGGSLNEPPLKGGVARPRRSAETTPSSSLLAESSSEANLDSRRRIPGQVIENSHTYRYDIRGEDGGDFYFVKLAAKEKKTIECIKRDLTFGAFVEGQYAFDPNAFSMSKTGILSGLNLIKWVYLIEDIHFANNAKKDTFIWRSNLGANVPFKLFSLKPSLKIFDEFSFDLEGGEGTCNDAGLGINVPLTDFLCSYVGWRHADRIHSYDTDYIETVVTLTF